MKNILNLFKRKKNTSIDPGALPFEEGKSHGVRLKKDHPELCILEARYGIKFGIKGYLDTQICTFKVVFGDEIKISNHQVTVPKGTINREFIRDYREEVMEHCSGFMSDNII